MVCVRIWKKDYTAKCKELWDCFKKMNIFEMHQRIDNRLYALVLEAESGSGYTGAPGALSCSSDSSRCYFKVAVCAAPTPKEAPTFL